MMDRPLPTGESLADVALRHRVTVKDVLQEWQYGRDYFAPGMPRPMTLDEAGAMAYKSRKGIEALAKHNAEHHMKMLHGLAATYRVNWYAIVREKHEGDWPDHESAARHLAAQRGEGLGAKLRRLFHLP